MVVLLLPRVGPPRRPQGELAGQVAHAAGRLTRRRGQGLALRRARARAAQDFWESFIRSPFASAIGWDVAGAGITEDVRSPLTLPSLLTRSASFPQPSVRYAHASPVAPASLQEGPEQLKTVSQEPLEELRAATPAQLRPLPSFERFLWAYVIAETRSIRNGERAVFFPQARRRCGLTSCRTLRATLA